MVHNVYRPQTALPLYAGKRWQRTVLVGRGLVLGYGTAFGAESGQWGGEGGIPPPLFKRSPAPPPPPLPHTHTQHPLQAQAAASCPVSRQQTPSHCRRTNTSIVDSWPESDCGRYADFVHPDWQLQRRFIAMVLGVACGGPPCPSR